MTLFDDFGMKNCDLREYHEHKSFELLLRLRTSKNP